MSQVGSGVLNSVAHVQVFPLALTLAAYAAAVRLQRLAQGSPLANPTLIAIVLVVFVLSFTGVSYGSYFAANQPINVILGPAVVALGVPLFRHLGLIRKRVAPLLLALIVGSSCAIVSVVELGRAFGLSRVELLSLAPRSATAGVSMAVSRQIGGSPALTAVLTITGGIAGAMLGSYVLNAMRIRDPAARGFGMGLASHGIATARAFQEGQTAGTFAGLAMGLNAIVTAILVPVLVPLLMH